jgi:hypothetical protein
VRWSRLGTAALVAVTSLGLATPAAAAGLTVDLGANVDLGIGTLDIGDGDLDVAGNFSLPERKASTPATLSSRPPAC